MCGMRMRHDSEERGRGVGRGGMRMRHRSEEL